MIKELAWRKSLEEVADNPDFIFTEMDALKKELQTTNNPSIAYLREKHRNIGEWIDEIERFHYGKKLEAVA